MSRSPRSLTSPKSSGLRPPRRPAGIPRGRRTSALIALAIAGLTALPLAGCGGKHDSLAAPSAQPLSLMLDYLPNPDHAPIYAAQAAGYFRNAGLDVTLQVPSDPAAPLKLLAAGRTDLAISYEPELLLARDRGLQLVSVGALIQRPLTSIISLGPRGVHAPAQLRGKRLGTAGIPYQTAELETILRRAGVPQGSVRQTDVGFNLVPAMLNHSVDATLGAFWNVEGVQLARARKHPNIIPVDHAGVPTYDELIIVARADELTSKGTLIRRFMTALARGAAAARRDPAQAVDALVHADPSLDRATQLASVQATLPAFFPIGANQPFGYQDPTQWAAYAQWMASNGLIKQPGGAEPMTNEFLPGQGI